MSGTGQHESNKWTYGVRVIAHQIDRATWRNTLTYRFHRRVTAGIEYNPLAGKASPLANVVALTEKHERPALILGTSSDRIGTPFGQSFYATLSKNLRHQPTCQLRLTSAWLTERLKIVLEQSAG